VCVVDLVIVGAGRGTNDYAETAALRIGPASAIARHQALLVLPEAVAYIGDGSEWSVSRRLIAPEGFPKALDRLILRHPRTTPDLGDSLALEAIVRRER
jgi:hypothetical protein